MSGRLWIFVAGAAVAGAAVAGFVADGSVATGTASQRLAAWATSTSLGQDIGTLQGEGRDVARAAAAHSPTGVFHTVCSAMATDAQTYNDSLPSPDTRVTVTLAKAYGLAYDAARECYSAGATDRSLLARSRADSARARRLFATVVRRIERVTRSTVPTTTTTGPPTTGTGLF